MAAITFIEYPPCSTCRKARKWLEGHGVEFSARHIVEDNPSSDELSSWIETSGLPFTRFFNTSGKLYRELDIKSKLKAGMSQEEALELLASNGMMVKRPIVLAGDSVLVGFKESEWEQVLL